MKRAKRNPMSTEILLEAANLSAAEMRLMVSNYYLSQEMRKRMDMQLRHLGDKGEIFAKDQEVEKPAFVLNFAANAFSDIEETIVKVFIANLKNNPVAQWMLRQRGIGPVITAGLWAHIDITKAPTVGHIWRFAGLDPSMKWEKGEKRPYNAELKQVCWHAGQCFMKQSNDPDCFYGNLYRQRKKFEIERNEAGGNLDKAKDFKVSPGATKAVKDKLKDGRLPDFNIDARARRYAVKIFLSHLHAVWFWHHFKMPPPKPFAIAQLGHAHEIEIPHSEMFAGFIEAYRESWRKAA
jgi:hypothetical protein